jgi:cytochrome c5
MLSRFRALDCAVCVRRTLLQQEQAMKRVLSYAIGAVVLIVAPQALAANGQQVYNESCAVCHNNLDPKISDKAAWAPRLKLGHDALVAAVINGKGAMGPRAGKPALSDGDIKAAVEYIEGKVK